MRRVEFEIVDPGGEGPRYVRLPELEAAGMRHGFSCRGPATGGRASAGIEMGRLADALGIGTLPRARLRQVHSAEVRLASDATGTEPPAGDALVTARRGTAMAILTADCVPILVVAPESGGAAAVHAGWRGTLAGVLSAAIVRLMQETGADPASLVAGVGPAIRSCCYEVGEEVESAFLARDPSAAACFRRATPGRPTLDLVAANAAQAARVGIAGPRFLDAGLCTRCRSDLFHSYRAEGPGAGRIVTLGAAL
jgi:YfiH family protein